MLLFSSDTNRSTLFKQEKAGKLIKLAAGIYSNDLKTEPEVQTRANALKILARLRPQCVISHISAFQHDFGVSDGRIFVTDPELAEGSREYAHKLPGLEIVVIPGVGALEGDSTTAEGVNVSSKGRALLECLESARAGSRGLKRTPEDEALADIVTKLANTAGATEHLYKVATRVNSVAYGRWNKELESLEEILEQTTVQRQSLLSHTYDSHRIKLFEELATSLSRGIYGNEMLYGAGAQDFPNRPSIRDQRFANLAFYVSYFSNYIEGTQFAPEEALNITEGLQPEHRARDGHDIRSLYALYSNPDELLREDASASDYIDNLKRWHGIFGDHPEKDKILPGQFKTEANRAGNTWFVEPHLVDGTLRKSWDIGRSLKSPVDQAIFRAVSAVMVHPFMDGNGRITRFAAANVLARAGKIHFMIPNVFREDYITAMAAFANGEVVPAIATFRRAMEITMETPWEKNWNDLTLWLKEKNAFAMPHEAKWGGVPPEAPQAINGFRF